MSGSLGSCNSDDESNETIDTKSSISSHSSDNDSVKSTDTEDMRVVAAMTGAWYAETYLCKQPYRDDSLTGPEYVLNVVTCNGNRCIDMLRMEPHIFINMCRILRGKGFLQDSRRTSVEVQVAMFFMTIGHGHKNRIVSDHFQHSGETISRYVAKVLYAICKWAKELIVPLDFITIPPQILHNERFMPWFENCIGAIDGTHISASVPEKNQVPFRGRKMTVTQNVMAACSFDMRFTFVYTGWEGTANDSRVFMTALSNPALGLPHPPLGKYYVVDAGYPNIPGYLAPYRHSRYHRSDFRGQGRAPRAKEFFNQRHSSLRNVIERCFGVLKIRFSILKLRPPYSVEKQAYIVGACCAIHNFLRMEKESDEIGVPFEDENNASEVETHEEIGQVQQVQVGSAVRSEMNAVHDGITSRLAEHYNVPQ